MPSPWRSCRLADSPAGLLVAGRRPQHRWVHDHLVDHRRVVEAMAAVLVVVADAEGQSEDGAGDIEAAHHLGERRESAIQGGCLGKADVEATRRAVRVFAVPGADDAFLVLDLLVRLGLEPVAYA